MHMGHMVTIAAALISLLIVPTLCVSGVITHACDCAEETCCAAECDCNRESDCRHETECPDDPCSIRVVRTERQGDDVLGAPQPSTCVSTFDHETEQPGRTVFAGLTESPGRNNRPYPSSDLPLLV